MIPNIITRRSFLNAGAGGMLATLLASYATIPLWLRRALAEGTIGQGPNPKKLLFIFLRGGNDALNSLIPIQDPAYASARPDISILKDPNPSVAPRYGQSSGVMDVVPPDYEYAIPSGNGFAALHPALCDLAPVFNEGDLALIHRVGYPQSSRSHFDGQRYLETGVPGDNSASNGIFYRTLLESGLTASHTLTGVSVQSNMPLLLQGDFPLINLSDLARYNLPGVYSSARQKQINAVLSAYRLPYPDKDNRPLVFNLGAQFAQNLEVFTHPSFQTNDFFDPANPASHLFPTGSEFNGRGVGSGAFSFFTRLKAVAQILANTETVIAGTELGGFDTHNSQGRLIGAHPDLLRTLGWAMYALSRFFSNPAYNLQNRNLWNDLVVVTLSEFGRASVQSESFGTDHGEAGCMWVAGGAVNGGIRLCDTSANPVLGQPNWTPDQGGTMFSLNDRYVRRAADFRSVLGELIRDHLGATQAQLDRIIPGYAQESVEHLRFGVNAGQSATPLVGELGLV